MGRVELVGEAGIDDLYGLLEKISAQLETLSRGIIRPRPKIVCLCGSTRFADAFQRANFQLTIAGQIVLSIGCNTKSDSDLLALGELTEDAKTALDELHKRKIDLADEILVLNVGGYIGTSTRSEIEYARCLGKPVRFLENPLRDK